MSIATTMELRPDVASVVEIVVRKGLGYEFAKQTIGRACGWESEHPDERQYLLAIQVFCDRTNK